MARAGKLRKLVTFQIETRVSDGGGGYSETWAGDITTYGGLTIERGAERLEAGRLEAALGGVLEVRASSETLVITEAYSVLIDGVRYQIRSIANPDQRGERLEMVVEKGVAI
jgi:SPP1 family predicted phage head-tail adaptor